MTLCIAPSSSSSSSTHDSAPDPRPAAIGHCHCPRLCAAASALHALSRHGANQRLSKCCLVAFAKAEEEDELGRTSLARSLARSCLAVSGVGPPTPATSFERSTRKRGAHHTPVDRVRGTQWRQVQRTEAITRLNHRRGGQKRSC